MDVVFPSFPCTSVSPSWQGRAKLGNAGTFRKFLACLWYVFNVVNHNPRFPCPPCVSFVPSTLLQSRRTSARPLHGQPSGPPQESALFRESTGIAVLNWGRGSKGVGRERGEGTGLPFESQSALGGRGAGVAHRLAFFHCRRAMVVVVLECSLLKLVRHRVSLVSTSPVRRMPGGVGV